MAQFLPIDDHIASGIDQTASPPWCMVPSQGTRTVRLVQGNGLTVKILGGPSGNVQITETAAVAGTDGRRFQISGDKPGEATLQALSGQSVAASLDISVFPRKEFKIGILFVYDRGGEKTGRPLSRLGYSEFQTAIDVVNNIYLPQVNISARIAGMGPAHVHDDLSQGLVYLATGVSKAELQTLPPTLSVFRLKTFPQVGCVSGTAPGLGTCDSAGLAAVSNLDLRGRLHAVNEDFNLFTRTLPGADFTYLVINKLSQARTWALTPKRMDASFPTACRPRGGRS